MIFYLTVRPVQVDGVDIIDPRRSLDKNWPGITFTYRNILTHDDTDGRWLYEFELDSGYSQQEAEGYRDSIIKGLAAFAAELETLASAKAKVIARLNPDVTDDGSKIVFPAYDPPPIG